MHKSLLIIGFWVFSSVTFAHAFVQSSSMESSVVYKPSEEIQINKIDRSLKAGLRIEGMNYLTEIPDEPALNRSTLMSIDLGYQKNRVGLIGGTDISAGQVVENQLSHIGVHEVYLGYKSKEDSAESVGWKVEAGRRKQLWSRLDQSWNLGLWQPTFAMDSLRPQQEGLTGIFAELSTGQWSLLGFTSPIFIPSMGSEIENKEGQLTSRSRWFRPMSDTFPLRGKNLRLRYSMDVPDKKELVSHPGSSLSVSYNKIRPGLFSTVSAGYKPMNSLLLKYRRSLLHQENAAPVGEAVIQPFVGYHSVVSADLGYRWDNAELTISHLEDRPVSVASETDFVRQQPDQMQAQGIEFKVSKGSIETSLSYLRIKDGMILDFDEDDQQAGAIFDRRWSFSDSARVDFNWTTEVFSKKTIFSTRYLRDFSQSGIVWGSEVQYYPVSQFAILMGFDVLGPDNADDVKDVNGFINQYRSNDRFYAGMSYVF